LKKFVVLSSLLFLVACSNEETDVESNTEEVEGTETVSIEEYEKLKEENENLEITVESLRDSIEDVNRENTELKEQVENSKGETDTAEGMDFQEESKEARAEAKESENTEDLEEVEEDDSEENTSESEEPSREEIKEEIESVLEEAGRPMEASVSQGVDGNFITLEGAARDGFSDEQIGRRVKEGMARILIAFQENDVDFEEVRISFYLPTIDAKGNEGKSNMALGVFDKETVDELNPENEFYIAESIESIALEFELDSQFQ